MRKIIYFLLLAGTLLSLTGCYETILVMGENKKVIQKYKGRLGEKISLVYLRKDGTYAIYSPDRASIVFTREKGKIYYRGDLYVKGKGGRYWGGYSPYWGDGLRAGDNPDAPRMYWR